MPFADFRQFLDVLRQHGELIDINRPIALNDVGKAMKQLVRNGPAIMFNDNGTDFPLVSGVYSTRSKALLAFEADEKTILDKVLDGLDNPIPPVMVTGRRAVPRGRHQRRRHRHHALSDPDLQPQGRRAVHHARHRGVEGSGDRRAGHRPLSLSHSRQGHVLVLGAAVPPLRQEPRQVPEDWASRRRPRWSSASIRSSPIRARCRCPTRPTTGRSPAACAARRSNSTRCKTCDLEVPATAEVVIEFEVDMDKTVMEGPLGEYTGYYTPAVAQAGRAHHRHHAPHAADLPGAAHRQAGHRKPHPQADPVRGVVPQDAQAPISDHRERLGARLGRRVVLCGDRDEPALRRRGAAGDPRRDGEQHPAEMDGDRRSRHRRALLDRGRMGDGVPRAAAAGRHRRRPHSGRAFRSVDRRSDASRDRCAPPRAIGIDATRPFGKPFSEVADVPGWEDYDVPELNGRR